MNASRSLAAVGKETTLDSRDAAFEFETRDVGALAALYRDHVRQVRVTHLSFRGHDATVVVTTAFVHAFEFVSVSRASIAYCALNNLLDKLELMSAWRVIIWSSVECTILFEGRALRSARNNRCIAK